MVQGRRAERQQGWRIDAAECRLVRGNQAAVGKRGQLLRARPRHGQYRASGNQLIDVPSEAAMSRAMRWLLWREKAWVQYCRARALRTSILLKGPEENKAAASTCNRVLCMEVPWPENALILHIYVGEIKDVASIGRFATPLMLAAHNGQKQMGQLLLDAGADFKVRSS